MKNLLRLTCIQCGNQFERKASDVRRGRDKFCSQECSHEYRTGSNNANWKGGAFINENGYKRIKVNGRYKYEHRHIVELHLGKKLNSRTHVHHINGNKLDNRLENLKVMSAFDHAKLHQANVRSRFCWICLEQGLEVKHYSMGLCKAHYEKMRHFERFKLYA